MSRTVTMRSHTTIAGGQLLWGWECECGRDWPPRGYAMYRRGKRLHAAMHRFVYGHTVVDA